MFEVVENTGVGGSVKATERGHELGASLPGTYNGHASVIECVVSTRVYTSKSNSRRGDSLKTLFPLRA